MPSLKLRQSFQYSLSHIIYVFIFYMFSYMCAYTGTLLLRILASIAFKNNGNLQHVPCRMHVTNILRVSYI